MPATPPPISYPDDYYALNLPTTGVTERMTQQQSPLEQIPALTENVHQAMGGFSKIAGVTLVLAIDTASHMDPMNFKWHTRPVSLTGSDQLSTRFQNEAKILLQSFGNRGKINSDKPVRFGCIIDYIDENADGGRLPNRDGTVHDYVYVASGTPTSLDKAAADLTIAKPPLDDDGLRALAQRGQSITLRR